MNQIFRASLCILFGTAVLFSCLKADKSKVITGIPTYDIMCDSRLSTYMYNASSIKDSLSTVTVYDSSEIYVTFNFRLKSGNPTKHDIKCFFSGLPPGVTLDHDTATFGLSYQNIVKFTISNCTPGFYLFYLHTYSNMEGAKAYPVRLHVLPAIPPEECASCMAGIWKSPNNCTTGTCNATITVNPNRYHAITIKNFACLGDSVEVYADVSCTDGINIPVQTSHGYTVYGSHKGESPCSYVFLSIPFTVIHNGDTQTCILHLQR